MFAGIVFGARSTNLSLNSFHTIPDQLTIISSTRGDNIIDLNWKESINPEGKKRIKVS